MHTVSPMPVAVKQLPSDLVAWFEKRGFQVDSATGKAVRAASGTAQFVVAPQPSPEGTRRKRYDAGFDAYCAGATLGEVAHDPTMLRGWNAALNAEAAAVTGYDVWAGW